MSFSFFLTEEPFKLFFHITFPRDCYVWIETFVILPYRPLDAYLVDDVFVTHQKRVHLPPLRPLLTLLTFMRRRSTTAWWSVNAVGMISVPVLRSSRV